MDYLAAYADLCETCNRIINDSNSDNEIKSNTYVILSFLRGQGSLENHRGISLNDLKKAVVLNPRDWRLHSILGKKQTSINNTALGLESICRAECLTTDPFVKFILGMRNGKVLMNLSRQEEAIDAFENVMSLYNIDMKRHPKMNDRIAYVAQSECTKASSHYKSAEEKRKSLNENDAKIIDWTSRMAAEMVISEINPGLLSYEECNQCNKVTVSPKRCHDCKTVFYCSRDGWT